MAIYKAPQNISNRNRERLSVFLAGSIEMGKAENWQEEMTQFFTGLNIDVFNPRRDDWDASWVQEYDNPQFFQQVSWELNALERADIIVMYFDPKTQSPISLLELGAFNTSGKLYVVCPDGFWRKGNVEIFCDRYNIPFYNNLTALKLDLSGKYLLK